MAKRCGFTAWAENRLWVCSLPPCHKGRCFAPRWDVERALWEWGEEEQETEQEFLLRTYGPDGESRVPAIAPVAAPQPSRRLRRQYEAGFSSGSTPSVDGKRRRRKHRDQVFAAFNDYVKTAVRWEGYEVLPLPTLDQQEGDRSWM
jgi:hypothetical protein